MNDVTVTDDNRPKDRVLKRRYIFPEVLTDKHGDTWRRAIEVTTSHDKDRKEYRTTVSRVMVSPRMVRWTRDFVQAPVNLHSTPTLRYSGNDLGVMHKKAIYAVAGAFPALTAWAADMGVEW